MSHLSLAFLGSFWVTMGGEPITAFRSTKVQGLLGYLVLNPKVHSRDDLAAMFWPDVPDDTAKKNLRQSLYQLRQVLGDPAPGEESCLLVTRSTAQFNPECDYSLDVSEFLACLEAGQSECALDLYRGDLLAGFTCETVSFEAWLDEARERLHRLALEALFELADRSLARADYRAAEDFARQQLALEPWREKAHRQLMRALALLNERSAALAQYEICRTVLSEELGVGPSTQTETLMVQIRDQRLGPANESVPAHRLLTIPFVGRAHEHEVLTAAYQRICAQGVRVVTLVGEAGIGKTRLSQYFLDWAATQGADTLRGKAFENSSRLSYQPLTHALRKRLERENAPEDLLSDLWLTQLARILPELRDRYPDLPVPAQADTAARQHLFEAITRLGLALAERAPVILFIDDWHWADAESLDALHYAALRWSEEQAPILVLLPMRQKTLQKSAHLQTWLVRLAHDVPCEQLSLTSLTGRETEHLIRVLLSPGERANEDAAGIGDQPSQISTFSRWLFEETEGQPLFLVETLNALMEDGLLQTDTVSKIPHIDWSKFDEESLSARVLPGIQEIIQDWLERVSAPARDLLSAAAVLGQKASFDNLCLVTDSEEGAALTALDELLNKQLLREADESSPDPIYEFAHQKVSETVYVEAGSARRKILHRRAFDVLQAKEASNAELAHHALHAGLSTETIRYSIAAGNEAMHLFAAHVAIVHYEIAWQLIEQEGWPDTLSGADRQELYTGLGRAYELIESWSQAAEIYQAMIADARSMEAKTIECLGLNCLATVCVNGFKRPQQAIDLLNQARTIAEESGNRRGLAETEWNLSIAARMMQDTDAARRHGEQALAVARELQHPQLLARCLNSLAYSYAPLRQWDRIEAYASEACDLYAASGDRILEADSKRLVGWSQMYLGHPQTSLATLQETYDFSRHVENLWGQAEGGWRLALTMVELGRYGEAIKLGRQAARQARVVGQPTMIMMALSAWGVVQRTVMALESACRSLLEALAECSERRLTAYQDLAAAELCTLYALKGDWEQAYTYAVQVVAFRQNGSLLPLGLAGWNEIKALLHGGDDDLARAEVERLDSLIGDNKRYRVPWLRSRAVLAQWDGAATQAIEYLQGARALAQEIGLPGEEWSIWSALGTLYLDHGDTGSARQAWKASADIIDRLANTIDDQDLRQGFLGATIVQNVLNHAANL